VSAPGPPPTPADGNPDEAGCERIDAALLANAERALPVFFRIADAWALSRREAAHLLGLSEEALREVRDGARTVDGATVVRLSYVFNIYAALATLLPIAERAHAWLKRPNSAPMFGGTSAIDYLMGGGVERLAALGAYLTSEHDGSRTADRHWADEGRTHHFTAPL